MMMMKGVSVLPARPALKLRSQKAAARPVAARRTVQTRAAIAMPATDQAMWGPEAEEHVASWRRNLDLKAWGQEMRELERNLRKNQGEEDVKHLKGVLNFSTVCYVAGLALASVCNPMTGNPIAAVLLSTAIFARWTMVGHHVSHGGYNAQQNGQRFHRSSFAKGPINRALDWLDWMLPEAWDVEHNNLHHYKLGETMGDPDLVERNVGIIRDQGTPQWFKYIQVYALMATWKWYYYAPNTLKEMFAFKAERQASGSAKFAAEEKVVQPFDTRADEPGTVLFCMRRLFAGNPAPLMALVKCVAPFFLFHFVAVPAPFFLFGGAQLGSVVLANMVLAEVLTNVHSFIAIATNHCGEDVYRFDTDVQPKTDEFYLRAVIGSVNYPTACDFPKKEGKAAGLLGNANDFMHGWLNYQIEHHMFPDLSMLSYQKAAPIVRAACEKYGVPYVQEDVFRRTWKTTDIMVGKSSMLQWERGD